MVDEYLRLRTEARPAAGVLESSLHVEHSVRNTGEVVLAVFEIDADGEHVAVESIAVLSPSAVAQLVGYLRESPVLRAAEARDRRESGGFGAEGAER